MPTPWTTMTGRLANFQDVLKMDPGQLLLRLRAQDTLICSGRTLSMPGNIFGAPPNADQQRSSSQILLAC